MPANLATGKKHEARILAVLAAGAASTADIAEALRLERRVMLQALRALERRKLITEAFRAPGKSLRPMIVWKATATHTGA